MRRILLIAVRVASRFIVVQGDADCILDVSLGPRPNQPQHGSLLVSRAGKEGSGRYSAHS